MRLTDDNKGYTELTVEDLEIFLKRNNHEYFTTHSKVCFEIIKRMHRRVLLGYDFGPIKVNGNRLIIDGNHRYLAYKLAGISYKTVAGGKSFSDPENNINELNLVLNEDWDYNRVDTRKFCTDEFLKECIKREEIK